MSSSAKTNRYARNPCRSIASRNADEILTRLEDDSLAHSSGGTFNVMARWIKGSRQLTGFNALTRPALTVDDSYPQTCGIHAELDLYRRGREVLGGGVVYIGGSRQQSRSIMSNTQPCVYCAAILDSCNVRFVVYRFDERAVISRPGDLVFHGNRTQ